MYKRNVSRGLIKDICEGSICMTWGTSENHIGLRSKVYGSILGDLYSKTGNLNSDFNGILPIDRRVNKETKPDVRAVFMTLY